MSAIVSLIALIFRVCGSRLQRIFQDSHDALISLKWYNRSRFWLLCWPLSMRPGHHDRFVLIGLCWLNGRGKSLSLSHLSSSTRLEPAYSLHMYIAKAIFGFQLTLNSTNQIIVPTCSKILGKRAQEVGHLPNIRTVPSSLATAGKMDMVKISLETGR